MQIRPYLVKSHTKMQNNYIQHAHTHKPKIIIYSKRQNFIHHAHRQTHNNYIQDLYTAKERTILHSMLTGHTQ